MARRGAADRSSGTRDRHGSVVHLAHRDDRGRADDAVCRDALARGEESRMSHDLRRDAISPRSVVLGALLVSYAWALVLPLRLTRPPSALLTAAYVVML